MSNYLQKRNGVYYFHKRVNTILSYNRNHIIRKSLNTKCYTTAKKLASLLNYWANVHFEAGYIMTSERMDEILYKYLQDSMEEYSSFEELRHQRNTIVKKDKTYEGSTKKAVLYHMKKHNKLDKRREFDKIKQYVEDDVIPLTLIDESELEELREMKEFYWKLFKYHGEVLKGDLSKFDEYSVEESIKKNKKPKANKTIVSNNYYSTTNEVKEKISLDSFDEMIERYTKELKKKKKLKDKTIKGYIPSYKLIEEVFPHKALNELTIEDLEDIEEFISHLPIDRYKKALTRDLNIFEQLEFMKGILNDRENGVFREVHKKYNVISERTQNKHFEQIKGFIEYCSKKYKFESALDGITFNRYRIESDSSTERLLFSDDELKTIFSEFAYLNKKLLETLKKDPLKVYGIFLMMYLGIRPIEAGQLMINDLQSLKDPDGNIIYYLSVSKENTSEDQTLDESKSEKTRNARRKLPLTDIFINDLKFIEFVKQRKKDKHKFIFVDEKEGISIESNIENTTRRCEDTFNLNLNKLPIEDLDRKSFYSIRHSFANKIKHLPEALKDKRGESLMGHSGAKDSEFLDRYGNRYFDPDFLYVVLEQVKYKDMGIERFSKSIEKLF